MVRSDPVDKHVLGRKHDDFPHGKYRHRQYPPQQAGGQRKANQPQHEHTQARDQPLAQVAVRDAPANQVLQGNHQHGVGGEYCADYRVGVFSGGGGHQVLRQVGDELTEHHGTEQSTNGETHQAVILEQHTAYGEE